MECRGLERKCFQKGAVATKLLEKGLFNYRTVDHRNIKKNLDAFMEQEEVEALNTDG